jgi:hypothetical protein
MTQVMKNYGLASFFLLLAACSNQNNGGTSSGTTGGNTIPEECQQYDTCSEKCYCTLSKLPDKYPNPMQTCAEQYCGSNNANNMGAGGGTSSTSSGGGNNATSGGGSTSTNNGGSGNTQTTGNGGSGAGGSTGNGGSTTASGGSTTGSGGTTGGTPQTQSFTITSESFTVPVGQDVYKCQNFKNPIGTDIGILSSESMMSPHSHHMFVFHNTNITADTTMSDCPNGGNEFSDFIHSAQTPQQSMTYPPGVGRYLMGTEGLRILVHYFNPTDAPITGQVAVTFNYVPKDSNAIQYLADEIFLNNALISVPPGVSTQSRNYSIPFGIKLLSGVSHMHSRGTGFTATTNTGLTLYQGTQWDEPQSTVYPNGLDLGAGTNITWSCTYNNTTGQTLSFGEHAATNEMCIFSGIFYTTDMSHQGIAINSVL